MATKGNLRNKLIGWGIGLLAVGALVSIVLVGSAKEKELMDQKSQDKAGLELNVPKSIGALGFLAVDKDGGVIPLDEANKDALRMEIVFDPHCGICHMVETASHDSLQALMKSGDVQFYFSPVSFMNRASDDDYSARAASTLVTVAEEDPENFFAYFSALYDNFPPEGSGYPKVGVNYEKLAKIAEGVGVSKKATDKFTDESYRLWAEANVDVMKTRTDLFPDGAVSTPAIFLGGSIDDKGRLVGAKKIEFTSQDDIDGQLRSQYEEISGKKFPKG